MTDHTQRARDLDQLQAIAKLPRNQPIEMMEQLERDVAHINQLPPQEFEKLVKMPADAVRAQYEAAAQAFEVMGDEVKDRIEKLQASMEEADASMKLLTEAAAAIRDKGKLAHAQIEEMSGLAKLIRGLHEAVMKKVVG